MENKQKTYNDEDVLNLTERDLEYQIKEMNAVLEQTRGKIEAYTLILANLRYRRNHTQ